MEEMTVIEEKRISPRHRVMKPGTIGFEGSGIECLVRNVYESGGAIEIKGSISVPELFQSDNRFGAKQ